MQEENDSLINLYEIQISTKSQEIERLTESDSAVDMPMHKELIEEIKVQIAALEDEIKKIQETKTNSQQPDYSAEITSLKNTIDEYSTTIENIEKDIINLKKQYTFINNADLHETLSLQQHTINTSGIGPSNRN